MVPIFVFLIWVEFLLNVVGRARASFRQSFRFGNMALRDRGHRLAGYLTPPSDATQEEEEAASERAVPCDTNRFGFLLCVFNLILP